VPHQWTWRSRSSRAQKITWNKPTTRRRPRNPRLRPKQRTAEPREPVTSRPASTTVPEHHSKSSVERQTHIVAQGNTIGKIAHRYHLREQSILRANGLRRTDHLKLGQTLLIPSSDDDPMIATGPLNEAISNNKKSAQTAIRTAYPNSPCRALAPSITIEPTGPGRNAMRPVLVYLHGRGGDAEQDPKWANVRDTSAG